MGLVRREPVMMIGAGLNSLILTYFSFFPGIHLTPGELAAIGTISTALCALAGAFLTTPANIGVIHASLTTILVAAAAFGLHLSDHQIAVAVSAIVIVLGWLHRSSVRPVVGMRLPRKQAPGGWERRGLFARQTTSSLQLARLWNQLSGQGAYVPSLATHAVR